MLKQQGISSRMRQLGRNIAGIIAQAVQCQACILSTVHLYCSQKKSAGAAITPHKLRQTDKTVPGGSVSMAPLFLWDNYSRASDIRRESFLLLS